MCANYSAPCVPLVSYETVFATPTSDRTCTPVTLPCTNTSGWYEVAVPTATTDRVCREATVCSLLCTGRTLALGGLACTCRDNCHACLGSNGGCVQCKNSRALLNGTCVSNCTAFGSQIVTVGSGNFGRTCAGPGVAAVPQPPYPLQYQSARHTPTSDTVCLPIRSQCPVGSYLTTPATPTSDIRCTAHRSCASWTEYEAAAPTATTDRACTAVTNCTSGMTYATASATPTSQTVCVPCSTSCPAGLTQIDSCSPTHDLRCDGCSTCATGEFEATQCSSGSDVTCASCSACIDRVTWLEAPCKWDMSCISVGCHPCDHRALFDRLL